MSVRDRLTLYPPLDLFNEGFLDTGDGHTLYYAECGNPNGAPALVVHGGPGGGSNPTMRRFHDPKHTRIILFDQRGCGRSLPNASIENNTTWHLIEDMERLRAHLGVERWQLFGGSWGSTLALAYAITHPERVSALLLRGIFLLRQSELDWFYKDGARALFPEAWDAFACHIPEAERGDMIRAYYTRLIDPDPRVHMPAAAAWSVWEGTTLSLAEDAARVRAFSNPGYALAFARIECHYFVNKGFFANDGALLSQAHRIAGIGGAIVHGRYDAVTPVRSAWDLKQAWPTAELRIVPDAGHAMTEPGIIHELVRATAEFRDKA
ncbi:proline iminopeptidase [Hyphomicrobium nitrativorans NL23]|uniref:Proline iminopeptidase n=1 Tax=Hyphomicrobium nitrativorans NL23 TaxID=1029756 RepID=V5SHJ6_9HYPH|nr:prolyl aminopeptidase [Hyphomicrobium nitrativorans]AHB49530.1 proline iminopeptidase [Hyphomicrobium nitrativorans NL23]